MSTRRSAASISAMPAFRRTARSIVPAGPFAFARHGFAVDAVDQSRTALDWAAERGLRFASVDDGDNPMGMKRSPVLHEENSLQSRQVERLCTYLDEHAEKPALRFIRDMLVSDVLRGKRKS